MRYFAILIVGILTISTFSIYSQRTTRKWLPSKIHCDSTLNFDTITYIEKNINEVDSNVFVCTGSSSKCFHSSRNCRGLKNCSDSIVKIPLHKAYKTHRKCKICYY